MKLLIQIDERQLVMDIEDSLLSQAQDFFDKLDADMDRGWQWEREFVQNLDALQRCQIITDRMLGLLEGDRKDSATLLAAYILYKLPGVTQANINSNGEISLTEFSREPIPETLQPASEAPPPEVPNLAPVDGPLNPAQAAAKARKEVSLVYEVPGGYQFKMLDPEFGGWMASETFTDREAAEEIRTENFQFRFQQLMGQA